jgi:hypothetical protein
VLPPNFAFVLHQKIHALQDSSKSQTMATVVSKLARPAYRFRFPERIARRSGLKHHDALLAQALVSALGDRIWVPNEKQFC